MPPDQVVAARTNANGTVPGGAEGTGNGAGCTNKHKVPLTLASGSVPLGIGRAWRTGTVDDVLTLYGALAGGSGRVPLGA